MVPPKIDSAHLLVRLSSRFLIAKSVLHMAGSRIGILKVCGIALLALAATVTCDVARADDAKPAAAPAAKVSYFRDVRPVLQEQCQGCHQPAKRSGEYVMTPFAALVKGGESGEAAIVPGKPEASNLVKMITPAKGKDGQDKAEMPKDQPPLAAAQIELISRWIREGAADDTPASAAIAFDADHPPVYRALPVLSALDFSPDGTLLAVSGYHEVLLHKADGSELVGRLVGLSERIQSLAFSPDGKWLAVAGGSPARLGEIQIWNVADRKLALSVPMTYDTLYGVSWSPDGTTSPSAAPTTRCGRSTPRRASRCCFRARTTTGCSTRSSRPTPRISSR